MKCRRVKVGRLCAKLFTQSSAVAHRAWQDAGKKFVSNRVKTIGITKHVCTIIQCMQRFVLMVPISQSYFHHSVQLFQELCLGVMDKTYVCRFSHTHVGYIPVSGPVWKLKERQTTKRHAKPLLIIIIITFFFFSSRLTIVSVHLATVCI